MFFHQAVTCHIDTLCFFLYYHQEEYIKAESEDKLIDEWPATALCANDLMSSCLYAIGLVTIYAGKAAPLAFVAVACVLYLFRSIYATAVLSFPKNGGSYNLLVNAAPKPIAALGACE